ncbi:serine hydrolase [Glycomyces scopariae]
MIGTAAWADGPTDAELSTELFERVQAYLATTGTQTEASVKMTRGTRAVGTYARRIHDTASIVKMEILLMLLEEYSSVEAIPADIREHARQMIVWSNNDSTTTVYNHLGGCDALKAAHVRYGLAYTTASDDCRWGLTKTNVGDQLSVINQLLYKGRLDQAKVDHARWLMGGVASVQAWGLRAAKKTGETVWVKNGWDSRSSLGGLWVVHSCGVISAPGQTAIRMAILTSKAPNESRGIQIVEEIAKISRSVIDKAVL